MCPMMPQADRLPAMDRIKGQIDRARQEQAAHVYACRGVACAECRRLQRRLDHLYRTYAHLTLYREARDG